MAAWGGGGLEGGLGCRRDGGGVEGRVGPTYITREGYQAWTVQRGGGQGVLVGVEGLFAHRGEGGGGVKGGKGGDTASPRMRSHLTTYTAG